MSGASPLERLLAKTRKTATCWLWIGGHVPRGYGVMRHQGRQTYAHRVSYLLHRGPIPHGLRVLHSCDTPACVNPDHLTVGTAQDNTDDMMAKGRHCVRPAIGDLNGVRKNPEIVRGERNGRAKLTRDQVETIRREYAAGAIQRVLAARFGVRQCHISEIVRGVSWAA